MRNTEKIIRLIPVVVFYIIMGTNAYFLFNKIPLNLFFKVNQMIGDSFLFHSVLFIIAVWSKMYHNYLAVFGLVLAGIFNMTVIYFPIGESAYHELIWLGSVIPFSALVIIFHIKKI